MISMTANILSNKIVRDLCVTLAGLAVVWLLLQVTLGVTNPFYVVSSGSMVPELEVNDIIIVQGKNPIDDVQIGDIIVFDRPSDHDRVIVHRVESITNENPIELIPGTDYPIEENKIGMQIQHRFLVQIIRQRRVLMPYILNHFGFASSSSVFVKYSTAGFALFFDFLSRKCFATIMDMIMAMMM